MNLKKSPITLPSDVEWKTSRFATLIIINEDQFVLNKRLHLRLKPYPLAILTEEKVADASMPLQDRVMQQLEQEKAQVTDFGLSKAVEEAFGDFGDHEIVVPKGRKVQVIGMVGDLTADHGWGSASQPIALVVPFGFRTILPVPAKDIWFDWIRIQGSGKDITDITGEQFFKRTLQEKLQGAGEKKIVSLT